MLVLKYLVGLHRTIQPQLLQQYWLGIGLDYRDIERFVLEINRDHSVIFEIASKYYILDCFVAHDGYCREPAREIPPMTRSYEGHLTSLASGLGLPGLIPPMTKSCGET